MIRFDDHTFQMGWFNHQLLLMLYRFFNVFFSGSSLPPFNFGGFVLPRCLIPGTCGTLEGRRLSDHTGETTLKAPMCPGFESCENRVTADRNSSSDVSAGLFC